MALQGECDQTVDELTVGDAAGLPELGVHGDAGESGDEVDLVQEQPAGGAIEEEVDPRHAVGVQGPEGVHGVLVHQGVTPNGDGINDVLTIDGILAYPDNQLTIVDRSGALIFQAWGYNNISKVFDGHSSINGRMQQPGTYFYALDYVAGGQNRRRTGYILLKY